MSLPLFRDRSQTTTSHLFFSSPVQIFKNLTETTLKSSPSYVDNYKKTTSLVSRSAISCRFKLRNGLKKETCSFEK
jgi:hypothetical protein